MQLLIVFGGKYFCFKIQIQMYFGFIFLIHTFTIFFWLIWVGETLGPNGSQVSFHIFTSWLTSPKSHLKVTHQVSAFVTPVDFWEDLRHFWWRWCWIICLFFSFLSIFSLDPIGLFSELNCLLSYFSFLFVISFLPSQSSQSGH